MPTFFVSEALALQPKNVILCTECEREGGSRIAGAPMHPLRRDSAPVTQTDNKLTNIVCKPGRSDVELHRSSGCNRTASVEQTGEQSLPLRKRGSQIDRRNVLISQQIERTQPRLDGSCIQSLSLDVKCNLGI